MTKARDLPAGASVLLDFVASAEAPNGYDTVYGNNQDKLSKPITERTVDALIRAQRRFTKQFGSSASGRYQFMRKTLMDLKSQGVCKGSDMFDACLQDRLGFALLRRRGYDEFMASKISVTAFARMIAMEWASMPVLSPCKGAHRDLQPGQSYYAGDARNRALVSIRAFTRAINAAYVADHPDPVTMKPEPVPGAPVDKDPTPKASNTVKTVAAAGVVAVGGLAAYWHEFTHWLWSFF